MGKNLLATLTALAVLYLSAPFAAAQQELPPASVPAAEAELLDPPTELHGEQPPVTPAPEAAPVPPEAPTDGAAPEPEPVVESEPAPAAEPVAAVSPAPGARKILVLPVEFIVYEKSVAGMEAVKDWTDASQQHLGEAALAHLRADDRFQPVALPQVETVDVLREHIELFKLVSQQITGVLQYGGKAWAEKKANPDYSIGDGLAFLADATGADYAFMMAGAQVKQTGGSVFMQLALAGAGVYVPGGGTYAMTGIVNLRSGQVMWVNSTMGMQLFGVTGSDTRTPATAREVVDRMFTGFPESKIANFPPF